MSDTLAQKLDRVQAAIESIESTGQAISQDGKGGLTRADLNTLYAREERLERKIARAARAGGERALAEF